MKAHTTIRITEKMLKGMNACQRAMKTLRPLLPLAFSTDPDRNAELAIALTRRYKRELSCGCCYPEDLVGVDLEWFGTNHVREVRWDYVEWNTHTDVLVLQQYMAQIADALAAEKGK